jgi:ribosomal protein S13
LENINEIESEQINKINQIFKFNKVINNNIDNNNNNNIDNNNKYEKY